MKGRPGAVLLICFLVAVVFTIHVAGGNLSPAEGHVINLVLPLLLFWAGISLIRGGLPPETCRHCGGSLSAGHQCLACKPSRSAPGHSRSTN